MYLTSFHTHTAQRLLLRVFGHTPDRDCYRNTTSLARFEAVSKISEYPHSRIQIFQAIGIHHGLTVDKVFRGFEGPLLLLFVCFVGRVMPVGGGLHTQGGQG